MGFKIEVRYSDLLETVLGLSTGDLVTFATQVSEELKKRSAKLVPAVTTPVVAKRSRGRPKGSKNIKRQGLIDSDVAKIPLDY